MYIRYVSERNNQRREREMLSTIGAILVTVVAFLVTAFVAVASFAAVLVSQLWTLAVQTYHVVNPMIVASWQYVSGLIA